MNRGRQSLGDDRLPATLAQLLLSRRNSPVESVDVPSQPSSIGDTPLRYHSRQSTSLARGTHRVRDRQAKNLTKPCSSRGPVHGRCIRQRRDEQPQEIGLTSTVTSYSLRRSAVSYKTGSFWNSKSKANTPTPTRFTAVLSWRPYSVLRVRDSRTTPLRYMWRPRTLAKLDTKSRTLGSTS